MEKEIVESKCQKCNMIISIIKGRDPRKLCFYCESKEDKCYFCKAGADDGFSGIKVKEKILLLCTSCGETLAEMCVQIWEHMQEAKEERYKESVKHILPPFAKEDKSDGS